MPRTCTVCRHPGRAEIDRELVRSAPFRHIAARYQLSCGPELGTVDEWPLYRRVVERVRAVWNELDGPPDFWREGKHDPPSTG